MRVFMGVGAWLLGVGVATAGSLLAVSLLGQGIAPGTSQQLTTAGVNQALAIEASEASIPTIASPIPTPSKPRPHKTRLSAPVPLETDTISPTTLPASQSATAPSPQPTRTVFPVPISTVLTSAGGTVAAQCQLVGAYLVSWSPSQGYETGTVARGPAATAKVTFESSANSVTMVVSCAVGVPTAATTVSGGDDGGGGGDE